MSRSRPTTKSRKLGRSAKFVISYLYGFKESGVLFQPVYLGPRDDVDDTECLTSQLKFKPEDEE